MTEVKVTVTTIHDALEWKAGVYNVPDEMPPDVAARLVEIKHAETVKSVEGKVEKSPKGNKKGFSGK